jgi:CheY-like chemotaxis protein
MVNEKILVVEDESLVAMEIKDRLESLGYVVPAIVSSGDEAIKKVEQSRPDLVLMDIVLKGDMDGIEAAEHIRSNFDIAVIFLTSYADEETLQRAKLTEPFGYILKPFEERELHSTIEITFYKHKMEMNLKRALENERQFKTDAAHYFFNPICVAKGYLHFELEGNGGKENIVKALQAIERIEKVVMNIVRDGEIYE